MKELIIFTQDMVKNPDGTYSTKRAMAWIILFVIVYLCIYTEALTLIAELLTTLLILLGVISYDNVKTTKTIKTIKNDK